MDIEIPGTDRERGGNSGGDTGGGEQDKREAIKTRYGHEGDKCHGLPHP